MENLPGWRAAAVAQPAPDRQRRLVLRTLLALLLLAFGPFLPKAPDPNLQTSPTRHQHDEPDDRQDQQDDQQYQIDEKRLLIDLSHHERASCVSDGAQVYRG